MGGLGIPLLWFWISNADPSVLSSQFLHERDSSDSLTPTGLLAIRRYYRTLPAYSYVSFF